MVSRIQSERVKEYVTFVSDPKLLLNERGIRIAIRDLTPGPRKYDCRIVQAIVTLAQDASPGSDTLWVRSLVGTLLPKPLSIRIVAELENTLPFAPYQEGTETVKALNPS
jgi:hypothetical protein